MKKSILILLLFAGVTSVASFSQVTKADIEAAIAAVGGPSKFTTINVTNVRTLYNDGTTPYTWYEYKYSETGYELTATSVVIKGYTDNTKSQVKYINMIPYDNIGFFSVGIAGFDIRLKNTIMT